MFDFRRRSSWAFALMCMMIMSLATPGLRAQLFNRRSSPSVCPPAPCLPPSTLEPPPSTPPITPQMPGQTQPQTPSPQQPAAAEPTFGAEQAAAAGGDTVALAAPNMIGDLLGAGRSVSFFYQRTMGSVFINGTGATNISNPKVAENNSPLPEDRIYFRYNYFKDALSVVGDTGETVFDPTLGLSRTSAPRFRGITASKSYDVNAFTFGGEKTFFNGRFSIEARVPFSHTLSSDLDL